MEYLQETWHIIHGDLKPQNIILDKRGDSHIADFGLATLKIEGKVLNRKRGTLCYMSPEIIKSKIYGDCIDKWAFGCIIYEMLVGKSPFFETDADADKIAQNILKNPVVFPEDPKNIKWSKDAKDIC